MRSVPSGSAGEDGRFREGRPGCSGRAVGTGREEGAAPGDGAAREVTTAEGMAPRRGQPPQPEAVPPMSSVSVPPSVIASCVRRALSSAFPFSSADWTYLFEDELSSARTVNWAPG